MAIEPKKFQIKIESVLGGHSSMTHFAKADQFKACLGIDPSLPITWSVSDFTSSGLLVPAGVTNISGSVLNDMVNWMIPTPNYSTVYVYDASGSVYSLSPTTDSMSSLGDLTDGGTASGNGAAYYDNYVYFSRDTTVARYGPLVGGSATFTDDYWSSTLGKTALTNQLYPNPGNGRVPNHQLLRHSDGKLYIADIVDGKGTIHFIQTTKTSVEGDTDNGSTYGALQFGYKLWPTALESYGSSIVIGLYESTTTGNIGSGMVSKVAFWDTVSQNFNIITWNEMQDTIITAIRNVNGVLYFVTGPTSGTGVKILKYVGGTSFEEVFYLPNIDPPNSGAVLSVDGRLLIGTASAIPAAQGCVYSIGLPNNLSQGVFGIRGISNTSGNGWVSALANAHDNVNNYQSGLISAWFYNSGGGLKGVDVKSSTYGLTNRADYWWSQAYKVGQRFKITKIRIPLAHAVAANMTVVPKLYFDEGVDTKTLVTINNTNYPNGERNIVIRPENAVGQHNFWLELKWTGSALCAVGLPITIEYELIDD